MASQTACCDVCDVSALWIRVGWQCERCSVIIYLHQSNVEREKVENVVDHREIVIMVGALVVIRVVADHSLRIFSCQQQQL